jgi:putative ABC transport system substrate-binding protein
MRRREVLSVLASAAVAWPRAACAQQQAIPVIGFLSSRSPGESAHLVAAFRRGLGETGFVEGQNMVIAFRWAEGHYDRLPALAADLVTSHVAVIVTAGGALAALAGKAATSTIPIVFTAVTDPVQLGVVQSLNHPGGNITGMGSFSSAAGGKRLGLLHELAPAARTIAMLVNPQYPQTAPETADVRTAAQALHLDLQVVEASSERDFDAAFKTIAQSAGALVVGTDPFFESRRPRIVELAAQNAIPAIYSFREYVLAGGLISYGISIAENYRQAGIYAGRIIRGEKPADLPVPLPTKFEMVINLKTAKALGIAIPNSMQLLADEVIE